MEREDSEEPETKDPKRKKKTPLQIEMLEKAYAENKHPSEAIRAELSVKLGLTNRQMQMWFCNRRLKDKKGNKDEHHANSIQNSEEKLSIPKESPTFYEYPAAVLASEIEDDALFARNSQQIVAHELEEHTSEVWHRQSKHEKDFEKLSKKKSQQTDSDLDPRATATAIMSLWGESFREDGPTLGFDFDPLPPGAFGMLTESVRYSNSISTVEHSKSVPFTQQDGNPADCVTGSKAISSNLKPALKNVQRDKQLVVVAREHGAVPHRLGAITKVRQLKSLGPQHVQHLARMTSDYQFRLDYPTRNIYDVQHVQGVLSRPSKVVQGSRETLSPCIKTGIKLDGYGLESRLKNGGEINLFPPEVSRGNPHETIVSFIKQHEVSAYVKQGKRYFKDEEVVDCNGHHHGYLEVGRFC
ncbi:hypothetical protein O6H91_06G021700 [Diphasiastrum complanatum]|uniref:Uncharacterized protein n=2 Tax=Diphasiastrum complanatum TaxID=34168 RepID=A0ACC2DBZ2_DIPCM|nr:hypothetical protein O6H91_24G005500 [Diphasiastrum complanatum]KAJ7551615.1 hypothetical protein O6H91_06G021700 [Diphasiastrum complanatum]